MITKIILVLAALIGAFTTLSCVCACMLSSRISRTEERLEEGGHDYQR